MTGLSVADVVNVSVSFTGVAAQTRNFGIGLIVGDSNVIDVGERIRVYANLTGVQSEHGASSPEALAAALYFSQSPQPSILKIARWARTATAGVLHGAALTTAQQALSNFTSVTAGSIKIAVDGGSQTSITGINLSGALNLNGVASIVQTAIAASLSGVTVTYDANYSRFNVVSATTGTSSAVSFASAAASGTDISAKLGLRSTDGGNTVAGVAAESFVDCVSALAASSNDWYALILAAGTAPSNSDILAAAAEIEGYSPTRIFFPTYNGADALNSALSTDIGALLKAAKYARTSPFYSSSAPYGAASLFALFSTIDYNGNNTTITAKFKVLPGVVAETLTETQANTLKNKNYNYFVNYENGSSIVQEGVMASGQFIDNIINADWLQNRIQTDVFNLLTTLPKVPQTDAGIGLIVATIKAACAAAVNNGFLAPGLWTGPNIGKLSNGDSLPLGYYVYAPLVSTQNTADRAARKSPTIQVAAKVAGAVHSVNCIVTVNV